MVNKARNTFSRLAANRGCGGGGTSITAGTAVQGVGVVNAPLYIFSYREFIQADGA